MVSLQGLDYILYSYVVSLQGLDYILYSYMVSLQGLDYILYSCVVSLQGLDYILYSYVVSLQGLDYILTPGQCRLHLVDWDSQAYILTSKISLGFFLKSLLNHMTNLVV